MSKKIFYRNKIDVISIQGIHVDAMSLWYRNGELMILEDEDVYVTLAYDITIFNLEK